MRFYFQLSKLVMAKSGGDMWRRKSRGRKRLGFRLLGFKSRTADSRLFPYAFFPGEEHVFDFFKGLHGKSSFEEPRVKMAAQMRSSLKNKWCHNEKTHKVISRRQLRSSFVNCCVCVCVSIIGMWSASVMQHGQSCLNDVDRKMKNKNIKIKTSEKQLMEERSREVEWELWDEGKDTKGGGGELSNIFLEPRREAAGCRWYAGQERGRGGGR